MIADSSVWIEWLRGTDEAAVEILDRELRARRVLLLPTILQEVLQGAASPDRFTAWQRAFETLPVARVADPTLTAVLAAGLYARCRWAGVTPRSANDCLIAMSCVELDQPLLHRDIDFDRIVTVEPRLRTVTPAVRKRG